MITIQPPLKDAVMTKNRLIFTVIFFSIIMKNITGVKPSETDSQKKLMPVILSLTARGNRFYPFFSRRRITGSMDSTLNP
jgi:hypothetical protein